MTKLEDAERWLMSECSANPHESPVDHAVKIAGELDYLRKSLARNDDELDRLRNINMATDAHLAETERQLDACQRELRKVRAELAALKGEAESLFYVAGLDEPSPAEAIRSVLYTNGDCRTEKEARREYPGHPVYAVRLSARKVEP